MHEVMGPNYNQCNWMDIVKICTSKNSRIILINNYYIINYKIQKQIK